MSRRELLQVDDLDVTMRDVISYILDRGAVRNTANVLTDCEVGTLE